MQSFDGNTTLAEENADVGYNPASLVKLTTSLVALHKREHGEGARRRTSRMSRYVVRRLLLAIPTLLIISLVLYAILSLAPGDPLSQFAANPAVPPEVRENSSRREWSMAWGSVPGPGSSLRLQAATSQRPPEGGTTNPEVRSSAFRRLLTKTA